MTTIGYARVSTTDQDLDIQIAALNHAGCHTIRSEKRSGTSVQGREELRRGHGHVTKLTQSEATGQSGRQPRVCEALSPLFAPLENTRHFLLPPINLPQTLRIESL